MTSTPHDPERDEAEDVPPGSPVPGESAPLHESDDPATQTSRQNDEDEATNPQGRILGSDDV